MTSRFAVAEKRRGLRRIAAGFGATGIIGFLPFVGELIAGTVNALDALHLMVAVGSGITALVLWYDARYAKALPYDRGEKESNAEAIASTLRISSAVALIAAVWPALRGVGIDPLWLALALAFMGLRFIPIRDRHEADSDPQASSRSRDPL